MTTELAHGRMMINRSSLRPGKSLLRNWASASESSSVTITTTTTQTTVFVQIEAQGTVGNVKAPAGPMKLARPAGPCSIPYELYFRNAVQNIRIVG